LAWFLPFVARLPYRAIKTLDRARIKGIAQLWDESRNNNCAIHPILRHTLEKRREKYERLAQPGLLAIEVRLLAMANLSTRR
jgi:hypothetical protein